MSGSEMSSDRFEDEWMDGGFVSFVYIKYLFSMVHLDEV